MDIPVRKGEELLKRRFPRIFVFFAICGSLGNAAVSLAQMPAQPTPPRQPVRDPFALRGYDNSYFQFESGFSVVERARRNPEHRLQEEQSQSVGDARYSLDLSGLIGWGPIRVGTFMFITHYRYKQSWGTDGNQIQRFWDSWLNSPAAETFLFPTKSLIRTHSLAAELRSIIYDNPGQFSFTTGVFTQLNIARQGSSLLGEEDEVAETITENEYLVPYLLARFGSTFQTRLAMPFRTDIDKQDPLLSNATYALSSRGRGRLFSLVSLNELNFQQLRSLMSMDLFYLRYRYASITEDRDRMGAALALQFPLIGDLWVTGRFLYGVDQFFLDKVRIPKTPGEGSTGGSARPEEIARLDTTYKFGVYAHYDLDRLRHHRLNLEFNLAQTISTIPEFNTSANMIYLGYTYTLPKTSTVEQRVDRFDEDYYEPEY